MSLDAVLREQKRKKNEKKENRFFINRRNLFPTFFSEYSHTRDLTLSVCVFRNVDRLYLSEREYERERVKERERENEVRGCVERAREWEKMRERV